MDYNTHRKRLRMPEYGRGIQEMVDYALTLTDRDERQRCANTIVTIMGNMFPHLRDVPDFKHKLWDHLAIMADYKLDIDYPYDIEPGKGTISKPEPLSYPMKKIRYRHYGYLLESLIGEIDGMPEGPQRDELALLAALQMKRSLGNWNHDAMDDLKVAADLEHYTQGRIHVDLDRLREMSGEGAGRQSQRPPQSGKFVMRRRRKN